MPDIKDSINEVYREQTLSDEARRGVLSGSSLNKSVIRSKFSWQPLVVSVSMVALLFIFVLTLTKTDGQQMGSSVLAPNDADDAVMERVNSFLVILEDGVISEEERRHYLMKSDWSLQLAFDTGTSIFYNRPNVTSREAQDINTLLQRMYTFVEVEQPVKGVPELDKAATFTEFLPLVSTWNKVLKPYTDDVYVSSLKEKPISKKVFFNMSLVGQLITVGFIVLFLYLFIQNIRFERKKHFFVFHVLALLFFAQAFIQDELNPFVYDETSILHAMYKLDENGDKLRGELLDVAQFGKSRYGLVQYPDGSLGLSRFEKNGNRFGARSSIVDHLEEVRSVNLVDTDYLTRWMQVIGVNKDSHMKEIIFIDQNSNESFKFPIDSKQPRIYFLQVPDSINNYSMKYMYEEEYELDEQE